MGSNRSGPTSRAKEVRRDAAARTALRRGADAVADVVKVTLGPGGRDVVLDRPEGQQDITTDGYAIARSMRLPDRFEDIGAQIMREASEASTRAAGDGAASAAVIGQALLAEGMRLIAAGSDAMAVSQGLASVIRHVIGELESAAVPANDRAHLCAVATTVCGDSRTGAIIGELVDQVGSDGQVRVQPGTAVGVHARYVRGMQIDRGWCSARLVTDPDRQAAAIENAVVLVTRDHIRDQQLMARILESLVSLGRPIVLIALEIDESPLELLVRNVVESRISALAIRAPGFGSTRFEILEDVAAFVGARVIQGLDVSLSVAPERLKESLGPVTRLTAWRSAALIEGGGGNPEDVAARIDVIREQIEKAEAGYSRLAAQERLARLSGRVAVLEVGAPTETEQREGIRRLTDSVTATKAALTEGVVAGGGSALAVIAHLVNPRDWPDEQRPAVLCVRRALTAPLRQIAMNAGFQGDMVVRRVQGLGPGWGFDARTGAYARMVEAGIVDPLAVARSAVLRGASAAMMILSTGTAVHFAPGVRWSSPPPRVREDL